MTVAVLTGIAIVFTLAGNIPAIRDIRRGDYQPVVFSWAGWALLLLIAGRANITVRQWPGGLYILATAAGCALVAVFAARVPRDQREDPVRVTLPGWRPRLDLLCLPGVTLGLVALLVVRNPALAVGITLAVDAALYVPTYAHAATHPGEESWRTYATFGTGAAAALATELVKGSGLTGLAYPVYLTAADAGIVVLILARSRQVTPPARRRPALVTARDLWMVAATAVVIFAVLAGVRIAQILLHPPGAPAADVAAAPSAHPAAPVTVPAVTPRHRPAGRPSPLLSAPPSLVSPLPAPGTTSPGGTSPAPYPSPSPVRSSPGPSLTPAPSPSVVVSPSPSPSPTPAPTPTPTSPEPSATPTPSPVPSPTASPTTTYVG